MPPVHAHTDTPCAWCGAPLDTSQLAGRRRVRCSQCSAQTTFPVPTAGELDEAYTTWYRPDGGRFSGPGDRLLARSRARLAGRIDEIAPPGPVLDIGSGEGWLVEALSARGREAVGIEREDDPEPAREANKGAWAAVVLWHALEHLPNPGHVVDSLPEVLSNGGVAVISVPNADSLQARVFGDRWFHLDLPRHLVHLPLDALLTRLRGLGLRVERTSHLRGGQIVFGWLAGLIALLPGAPSLYDAIRRPTARSEALSPARRAGLLALAVAFLPLALLLTALEVATRRGGTIYVEARRV